MSRKNYNKLLPTLLPFQQGHLPNPYELLMNHDVSQASLKSYKLNLDNVTRLFDSYNLDFLFIEPEQVVLKITRYFGESYYVHKVLNAINKYLNSIHCVAYL